MIIRRVEQREDGSIIESSREVDEEENKIVNDDELYMMISNWIRENFISVDKFEEYNRRIKKSDCDKRNEFNGGK